MNLRSDLPRMVKIEDIVEEAEDYKTFLFRYPEICKPGQFLMIWLPRINEKPFTVAYSKDGVFGITVQRKGEFTAKLFSLSKNDSFGVRGPYGNGYTIKNGEKTCIIAGGSGAATILPLKESMPDASVIVGGRSKEQLLFTKRLQDAVFTTDDGSYGYHGTVVQAFLELLNKDTFDRVFTCGPEKMMQAVIAICREKGIACQFTLERYMKCGIGICGNCTCGKKRVCVEGPVFSLEDLPALTEFNVSYRTKNGKCEFY